MRRPDDAARAALRIAMRADTCPSASHGCGCGSIPRHCGRIDRPPEVFRARDCLPCVSRGEWEANVEGIG